MPKKKIQLLLGMALIISTLLYYCGSRRTLTSSRGKSQLPVSPSSMDISWSGTRSSRYGIKPFPNPQEWKDAILQVNRNFPTSTPCAIWIVGIVKNKTNCLLGFPGEEALYPHITFTSEDQNVEYLDYFDAHQIKVFLQVEPANAPVPTLFKLVYNQYRHHPCVIGFGVDVEWYREVEWPGWGIRVNDSTAQSWENLVKSFNPDFLLFLKHWDRRWMPPHYRGDIIFISDSQMLETFDKMADEFITYWADYFYPNRVGYQIGYGSDSHWWEKLNNPIQEIGIHLARRIKQSCGIFWVDFTLRRILQDNQSRGNQ